MTLKIKNKNRVNIQKEEIIKDLISAKIVRLNINLPESVLKNFKIKAIHNNTSMSELILLWINEYINK